MEFVFIFIWWEVVFSMLLLKVWKDSGMRKRTIVTGGGQGAGTGGEIVFRGNVVLLTGGNFGAL